MNRRKIIVGSLVAAVSAGVLAVTGTADAAAGKGLGNCGYPYVCLYRNGANGKATGKFRDVTRNWQWLNRSKGALTVVNTRRDDVVYLLPARGKAVCLEPRQTGGFAADQGGVKAVRISRSSRC